MSFFRRSSNPNSLVLIFLLVIVAVITGPTMLPRLMSYLLPTADESIRCDWLRSGFNRAEHQSLIGRAAGPRAISLKVRSTAVPQPPGDRITIIITVTNESIGTVAIQFNPKQIRFGDDGVSSGLGLIFNSTLNVPPGPLGQGAGPIPEDSIRLLGPRQSCIHRVDILLSSLPDPSIATGAATVKAYYRNTTTGIAQPQTGSTPIFSDQGLWVGVTESTAVPIPLASS
jgi:hypothetical protein